MKYQATTIIESEALGRDPIYLFADGNRGQLEYDDPRFIKDDLLTLVELRLLRQDYTPKGSASFKVTRNGAKLVTLSE